MKIGLQYNTYNDISYILYVLQNGKVTGNFHNQPVNGQFRIDLNDDCYLFSNNFEDIKLCDRKIRLDSSSINVDNRYHRSFFTPNDTIRSEFTNDIITNYLNNGNILLSMSSSSITHPNFIFEPLFGLVHHYYYLGFNFLNFYGLTEKQNLLGIYHNPIHIGGSFYKRRDQIYNDVKSILNDDFVKYDCPNSELEKLLNSYRYFGNWYKNHISGYSDYATSVCNLIFESNDSLSTHVTDNRMLINEKTLKGLLFSKENIFFMWYGNEYFLPYLMNYGFWFLNFEFYDPNDTIETPIYNSVIKTTNYLKELKDKLHTTDNVHKFLLKEFGHKLNNNGMLIDKLIKESPIKDRVINLLKS